MASRTAPTTSLQAEVVAASVAAAHNQVLRHWLRADGKGDPFPELDAALGYVKDVFQPAGSPPGSSPDRQELIVLAFDSATPAATVTAELKRALDERRRPAAVPSRARPARAPRKVKGQDSG